MSASIIEALQNAEINLKNGRRGGIAVLAIAQAQMHNAIVLLDKGYGIYDEVEPLLEKYGDVESVPDAQ